MKSGIYLITNKANGKVYVGSSVNISTRKTRHFRQLRNGNHHSIYLQRAFNKYGEGNFIFSVIEECEKERLIDREQFYIDSMKPAYNNSKTAGNALGVKHRPETNAKNKARNSGFGNGNAKISQEDLQEIIKMKDTKNNYEIAAHFCVNRSTIERAIKRYTGMSFNKVYSQKGRQSLSDLAKGRRNKMKPTAIKDDNGVTIKFDSVTDAAKHLGVSVVSASRSIALNKKCAGYSIHLLPPPD